MNVDRFDFDLPDSAIALRPTEPRDAASLLVVRPGAAFADHIFRDLADLLEPGDALVFNDTKVIPAELHGLRRRGEAVANILFTLHMRVAPDSWRAFARPGKRLKPGDTVVFGDGILTAEVTEKGDDGQVRLVFDKTGPALDTAIMTVGTMPLPPYISARRPVDAADAADYQTIYARDLGAVAAPTAGLHFTDDLFAKLDARGISRHFVTLHVGAGTFLPVKVDDTDDHIMHAEWGTVSAETAAALNATRDAGRRVVAVGTTSLRLLESAVDGDGRIQAFSGETAIFITPGKRIRSADALVTNFHLPRSTLFMLVSAFSGLDTMRAAYDHAIKTGYRFYSYGDASLLFPDTP